MKTPWMQVGAALLFVVSLAPQTARACIAVYSDFDVDTGQHEVEAWASLDDCSMGGGGYYYEHYYQATVHIDGPTQNSAGESVTTPTFPGGGGSVDAHASLAYGGDPGIYDIETEVKLFCSLMGLIVDVEEDDQVEPPECSNPPLAFHTANPRPGAPLNVNKSGSVLNGTITIQGTVSAIQSDFDAFKQGVESYWNRAVTAAGIANVTIDIQLTRDLIFGTVDLTMPIELPPGPGIINCGSFNSGTREMIVRNNLTCSIARTSAHEMGHWLKFADAYDTNATALPIDILHCDPEDLMALGDEVKWYHGALLWGRL